MKQSLPIGVTLSLIACFLYSAMTAFIKVKAVALPPLPIVVFMQNLFALTLLLPRLLNKKAIMTRRLPLHALRAIFSLAICYSLYYAITFIPLVNAMLLANAAPLIVPIVGYLFFSEKINHRLWLPILIGYAGVAFVLRPDTQLFNIGAFLALASALALAFTIQCVRKLSQTESTLTITFYFLLFSAIFSGMIAIPFWQALNANALWMMFIIGFLYLTSQYLANASMRYASAQLISSLMYSNVIYATIMAFFIWGGLPTLSTNIGMLLIIIGGIYCIQVEQRATTPNDETITAPARL